MASKIPSASDIDKEFAEVLKEMDSELRKELVEFRGEMIDITPEDKGKLKKSYSKVRKVKTGHYRIVNRAQYSHQLLVLGRTGPGKGSLQLPDGMYPEIRKWVKKMEELS